MQPVNKQLYKSRLLLGSQSFKASVGYIDSDPQGMVIGQAALGRSSNLRGESQRFDGLVIPALLSDQL